MVAGKAGSGDALQLRSHLSSFSADASGSAGASRPMTDGRNPMSVTSLAMPARGAGWPIDNAGRVKPVQGEMGFLDEFPLGPRIDAAGFAG
jgi:hypothetical protein